MKGKLFLLASFVCTLGFSIGVLGAFTSSNALAQPGPHSGNFPCIIGDIDIYYPAAGTATQSANNSPVVQGSVTPGAKSSTLVRYDDNNDLPPFTVFSGGKSLSTDKHGIFSLPLDQFDLGNNKLKNLSILFCERVKPAFHAGSTLKGLQIDPTATYRFFTLAREFVSDKQLWVWDITEQKVGADGFVSDDAIIISVAPEYFKSFKQFDNAGVRAEGGSQRYILPRIELLFRSKTEVDNRAVHSLLANGLDLSPYHTRISGQQNGTDSSVEVRHVATA